MYYLGLLSVRKNEIIAVQCNMSVLPASSKDTQQKNKICLSLKIVNLYEPAVKNWMKVIERNPLKAEVALNEKKI